MDDLPIDLAGLEVSSLPGFVATRDLVRAIVKRIADALGTEGVTVAVDETAAKEKPEDTLIVFDGSRTGTMVLAYTPKLVQIGGAHHFVAHADGVNHIADEIVTAVNGVLRRWQE